MSVLSMDEESPQDHPLFESQSFDEALQYAQEAMEGALALHDLLELQAGLPAAEQPRLDTALQMQSAGLREKFQLPAPANESAGAVVADSVKGTINALYAVAKRVFQFIVDLFRNHKRAARESIQLTKEYIGRADQFSGSSSATITDLSVLMGLQVGGIVPKQIPQLYQKLIEIYNDQKQYAAIYETMSLVLAAKKGNEEEVFTKSKDLYGVLLSGLQAVLKEDPTDTKELFKAEEKEHRCFGSEVYFGQRYVLGAISQEATSGHPFFYKCGIRRDPEVPLRTTSVEVLSPDDIRLICRSALKLSENILRNSREEELLQRAFRELDYVATRSATQEAATALRLFGAMTRNSYICYLRLSAAVTRTLLRYCSLSLLVYEKENHVDS